MSALPRAERQAAADKQSAIARLHAERENKKLKEAIARNTAEAEKIAQSLHAEEEATLLRLRGEVLAETHAALLPLVGEFTRTATRVTATEIGKVWTAALARAESLLGDTADVERLLVVAWTDALAAADPVRAGMIRTNVIALVSGDGGGLWSIGDKIPFNRAQKRAELGDYAGLSRALEDCEVGICSAIHSGQRDVDENIDTRWPAWRDGGLVALKACDVKIAAARKLATQADREATVARNRARRAEIEGHAVHETSGITAAWEAAGRAVGSVLGRIDGTVR